jgi:hypothetical protein
VAAARRSIGESTQWAKSFRIIAGFEPPEAEGRCLWRTAFGDANRRSSYCLVEDFSAPNAIDFNFLSAASVKSAAFVMTYGDCRFAIIGICRVRGRRSLSDLAFHWF